MMRFIAGDYFARSPVLVFPLISLVLFGLVFGAVLIVTLRKKERDYRRLSMLPLDETEERHHG